MSRAIEEKGYAQRRACGLTGLEPEMYRSASTRGDDAAVRVRLRNLAGERRRFGYRRLLILLWRDGITLSHRKLFRLYREERLSVRRRGGRTGALGTRAPAAVPQEPNQRRSLDFVSDTFADGRRFRILVVVDDCLNEHLCRSLPAARTIVEAWRVDDNTCRLHTRLGGLTPNAFATRFKQDQNQNGAWF